MIACEKQAFAVRAEANRKRDRASSTNTETRPALPLFLQQSYNPARRDCAEAK